MKRIVLTLIVSALMLLADADISISQGEAQIVFASNRTGNREIFIMNAEGGDAQQLTFNPDEDRDPVWSPDRSQIAFASNQDDRWGIFVMNADGSNQRRITPNDGNFYDSPAWSPDGRLIALVTDRGGGLNIATVNVVGGDPQLVTQPDRITESIEPVWSPDGQRIAFASNKDGYFSIYFFELNTGRIQRVTQDEVDHYSPSWSPTGSQFAYSINNTGSSFSYSEIYLANANGSDPQLIITADGYYADSLTWSPDEERLAYVIWNNQSNRSIRMVNIVTAEVRQVTSPDNESAWVSWYTPEVTASPPYATSVVTGEAGVLCSGSMPTRMAIGMSARVAYDDRDRPLRLRRESNTDSDIVAELEQGTEFTVLDEHQCSDVYTWWHIETNDGLRGWVAEADPTQNPQLYFIEPTSLAPRTVLIITDSSCPGAPPTNFQIGDIAQVDFNADGALLLTVSPRGDRPSRDNVGQLHDNEQMEIQNGPVCAGDRWRWYVRDLAAGMRGWASEGVSGDAWICSLSNPECGS